MQCSSSSNNPTTHLPLLAINSNSIPLILFLLLLFRLTNSKNTQLSFPVLSILTIHTSKIDAEHIKLPNCPKSERISWSSSSNNSSNNNCKLLCNYSCSSNSCIKLQHSPNNSSKAIISYFVEAQETSQPFEQGVQACKGRVLSVVANRIRKIRC